MLFKLGEKVFLFSDLLPIPITKTVVCLFVRDFVFVLLKCKLAIPATFLLFGIFYVQFRSGIRFLKRM